MLSEVLFASVQTKREREEGRAPGLSISQLFPCPYRLYKVHMGEIQEKELEPRQVLNMADGWDVEEQSVRRLAGAGVLIKDRQAKVRIGKSGIPGSIDGTFTLNGKKRLWEHKAWGENSFGQFLWKGLDTFPGAKAQINGYMVGMNLDEADFFVKKKDNNDYFDKLYRLDEKFIIPIIEWADRIRLEGWVPEPRPCEYCTYCGLDCFGKILDFSWIGEADAHEMVVKWKQGDKLVKVGEMFRDGARAYFVGEKDKYDNVITEGIIGDRDLLLVEDLEVKKITQHRFGVSKQKVMEVFGPEGLVQVGEEKEVVQYRIREVSDEVLEKD